MQLDNNTIINYLSKTPIDTTALYAYLKRCNVPDKDEDERRLALSYITQNVNWQEPETIIRLQVFDLVYKQVLDNRHADSTGTSWQLSRPSDETPEQGNVS